MLDEIATTVGIAWHDETIHLFVLVVADGNGAALGALFPFSLSFSNLWYRNNIHCGV